MQKKIILLLLLIIAIITAAYFLRQHVQLSALQSVLKDMGIWAPLLFIVIYASATVLFLPGSVLTLAGGFIFGPLWGTLYNLCGAVLGSSIAFLIARYIAYDWVEQKAGGKLKSLMDGVAKEGWKFVAIVRLVPLFPFNFLNYALGLTAIPLTQAALASAVFMFPGALAYTYVGSLGQTALAGEVKTIVTEGFIALGLLVLVASLPWLIKQWRANGSERK